MPSMVGRWLLRLFLKPVLERGVWSVLSGLAASPGSLERRSLSWGPLHGSSSGVIVLVLRDRPSVR